jgi:hypothetical protein
VADENGFPRFFAYGGYYIPPALYIRAESRYESFVVDPNGIEEGVSTDVGKWLERVTCRWMCETTQNEIAEAIASWNRRNGRNARSP